MSRIFSGSTDNWEIGETRELGNLGEDMMYITLEENQTNCSARGYNMTTSSLYNITYRNVFGVTKDAFKVHLSCNWFNDGDRSYINYLNGTYTILDNSFRCEWGKTSATELIHSIELFAYHEGAVSYYLASAHCNILVSPATVDLYL